MSNQSKFQEEEMSLKELILLAQDYFKELIRKWWLVAGICMIALAISLSFHFNHKTTYNANLKFVVEGQTQSVGGLGGLLGSLGINRGSSLNPYKIQEVAKSSDIFFKVISTPSDSGLNIANHILNEYKLAEEWSENNPEYQNFQFNNKTVSREDGILHQKALKKLMKKLWGTASNQEEALARMSYDMESGIYTLKTKTTNETLSLKLSESIYHEIKQFFELEMLSSQQQLSDILTAKADSIKQLGDKKIRQLARFDDRNRGVVASELLSSRDIIIRDNQVLYAAYAEIMKSKEMTDVSLQDRKPLFLSIDMPFKPLPTTNSTLIKSILHGLLFGIVTSILILFAYKFYKSVMNE